MTLQIEAIHHFTLSENDRGQFEPLGAGSLGRRRPRKFSAWPILLLAVAAPWTCAATQGVEGSTRGDSARATRQTGSARSRRASADTNRFVGSWRLVSFEGRSPDGRRIHPMGEQPSGQLIYDAKGQVSVQYMRRDRPEFASGDLHQGSPEEIKAAFEGYIGYWGTYDVDERAGTVTHHVAGASFPNWVGGEQKRFYSFDHNHLTFKTPPILIGGVETTNVIVWERIE